MATKEQILSILEQNRGQALSGEALAQQIGVSRTAIWKAVQALQKSGHPIDAVTNRGYTLRENSNMLSAEGIRPFLCYPCEILRVEQTVDSTNNLAKQLAAAGAPHGTLVVADRQTSGRGRRGRAFVSPAGTGLYLTLVLRSALSMESAARITCAAAVAACRALERVCGKQAQIKWVNDLYYHGKKCCGILSEAAADVESGGVDYIVVGIGLNLREPEGGFPPEIAEIATALFEKDEPVPRCALAAAIANELMALTEALPHADFMQEYRARNFVLGHDVTILQNGQARPAKALAITDSGHLLVETPGGATEELSFGEVSIRLSEAF